MSRLRCQPFGCPRTRNDTAMDGAEAKSQWPDQGSGDPAAALPPDTGGDAAVVHIPSDSRGHPQMVLVLSEHVDGRGRSKTPTRNAGLASAGDRPRRTARGSR